MIVIAIIIGILFYRCPLCQDLLFANVFYAAGLLLISLFPLLFLIRMGWILPGYSTKIWILFFAFLGLYYSKSTHPDFFGMAGMLIRSEFFLGALIPLLAGMVTFIGMAGLFYFSMDLARQYFSIFPPIINVKNFTKVMMLYLIYLNATISVLNPLFSRPF